MERYPSGEGNGFENREAAEMSRGGSNPSRSAKIENFSFERRSQYEAK